MMIVVMGQNLCRGSCRKELRRGVSVIMCPFCLPRIQLISLINCAPANRHTARVVCQPRIMVPAVPDKMAELTP